MTKIGMGIIGAGFIGPHHVDAVRRLGFVDVIALADVNEALAKEKAAALHIPKSYGSYAALLADPSIQVVHNATPNFLHYEVNAAIIAAGKHVVSDKPLALSGDEARKLRDQAVKAGVFHGVTFGYRGNPLVQQARKAIAAGQIGRPHFVHGHYLQDWLLKDTDYSWRLEPDKGGESSALGDIGSHWLDLVQHVTGMRVTHVLGDMTTVIPKRKRPTGRREAFAAGSADEAFELVDITVEDLATVLVRFDSGAKGVFTAGQVCAGHKNDLMFEVCGAAASLKWRQEQQNELWIGRRDTGSEILPKDPGLMVEGAREYAHLPGGHQEGWADAFCNVMRDIYGTIAAGKKPTDPLPGAFATFEDGFRANAIVDAIVKSSRAGGVWTKVTD